MKLYKILRTGAKCGVITPSRLDAIGDRKYRFIRSNTGFILTNTGFQGRYRASEMLDSCGIGRTQGLNQSRRDTPLRKPSNGPENRWHGYNGYATIM